MSEQPNSPQYNRIKVKCGCCAKTLAHRINTEHGWMLHLRYGSRIPEIQSFAELYVKCPGCTTVNTITPDTGVTHTTREAYDSGLSTQDAGSKDSAQHATAC